jgi:hypothetical protein
LDDGIDRYLGIIRREGRHATWLCTSAVFLLSLQEMPHQFRNFICFGVEREVPCVEYVDLRVRYILEVTFRFARIEREIVLAPKDKKLYSILLCRLIQWQY